MRSNKVLVLDLDGTLTRGGEDRISRELRDMLSQFKEDGWILILATGRDRRYLESREDLVNIFDGWVCESGISIWIPSTGDYRVLVDERWCLFINEIKKLECIILKENTVNLSCNQCMEKIRLIASSFGIKYKILNNKGSLLLLPENIDKFVGLNELLKLMNFKGFVAAVGDSEIDFEMLKNADFKAAPLNADQVIKEIVDYLSSREDGEGVIDILNLLKRRFVGDC